MHNTQNILGRGITLVLSLLLAPAIAIAAEKGEAAGALTITSSAFEPNGAIPKQYTCEGDNISPPLHWSGMPKGTESLALIVDDPDAPDPKAPRITWVHWVLYNIPPTASGLQEAVHTLPGGTAEGKSSWKRTGYGGPCPPIGRHRYFFKLYALDTVLTGLDQPDKDTLEAALPGKVLDKAQLIGTYQKEK